MLAIVKWVLVLRLVKCMSAKISEVDTVLIIVKWIYVLKLR